MSNGLEKYFLPFYALQTTPAIKIFRKRFFNLRSEERFGQEALTVTTGVTPQPFVPPIAERMDNGFVENWRQARCVRRLFSSFLPFDCLFIVR